MAFAQGRDAEKRLNKMERAYVMSTDPEVRPESVGGGQVVAMLAVTAALAAALKPTRAS